MDKPKPETECAVRVMANAGVIVFTPHSNDARDWIFANCGDFGDLYQHGRVIDLHVMDGFDITKVAAWVRGNFPEGGSCDLQA